MLPHQIGFGTYKITEEQTLSALENAFSSGYTHIDCAAFYGNEKFIGNAFTHLFKTYKRENFFITSKIWPTMMENVNQQLQQTLADLQLTYLDLYLIHQPIVWDASTNTKSSKTMNVVWKEMEICQERNLTRHIGVSNFSTVQLKQLLETCKIPPFLNQIESSLEFQNDKLINFCLSNNIFVTGYRTLMKSSGTFSDVPELEKLAQKYQKSIPQIVLRWHTQKHGENYSVLVKSSNAGRCRENIEIFDFSLENEEIQFLNSLDQGRRTCFGVPEWQLDMEEK